ncbi:hypothetical protein WN51_12892 [Melipona quadrifasciata]|uniref:Uncharacterized protein n=1 Tax=Melipona quadrifasciata TaxID=166423 RepID=A0A0M9A3L9_9HYME|nr:hypothetical protein WN51_12892 [Melipona quadrifasciata]
MVQHASLVNAHGEPCLEYGCPGRPQYEPFVPAPPGHTPNCAKPGQTFCESLDHYPRLRNLSDQHLKRSLIEGYAPNNIPTSFNRRNLEIYVINVFTKALRRSFLQIITKSTATRVSFTLSITN